MPAKPTVVTNPLTNRGTAFTIEERRRLGLIGRFPSAVETLDQQAARTYRQLCGFEEDMDKYGISVSEAQAGDLYFWGDAGSTYHVAIATGGGNFIHASQPGTPLGYNNIQNFTPQFAVRVR